MCGIFGLCWASEALGPRRARRLVDDLLLFSESRGKEAAGLAVSGGGRLAALKSGLKASSLARLPAYAETLSGALEGPFAAVGHARLVTDGGRWRNENNQPVVKHGRALVHNGIIANVAALYAARPELSRLFEVDSEVLLDLYELHARGKSPADALRALYAEIEGAASIALLSQDGAELVLASNTGSLYAARGQGGAGLAFASERWILERALARDAALFEGPVRLGPFQGAVVDLATGAWERFGLKDRPSGGGRAAGRPAALPLVERVVPAEEAPPPAGRPEAECRALLRYDLPALAAQPRCRRCVLPAGFPWISFQDGVCDHCRGYEPSRPRGREALERALAPHRRKDGGYDCLVNLSGGRDSCYLLHLVKTELGLNPLAYTYDWAVLTDPARRNQSRICAKLGVEHVIVSADIPRKRGYIRDNIEAWLRRPHLGMIPLFMAGDKQLYYHSHEVKAREGITLAVMGEHRYEKTRFKTSFTGVEQTRAGYMAYHVSPWAKLRLGVFYGLEYLRNPAYLNASFLDSLWAFASYYVVPHDYLNLYEYLEWDEADVERVLRREYGWEGSPDTTTTWRIDDGTAAFYNYLYCTLAGFTENDAFRSNQVRAGKLTREAALETVLRENAPRYESIRWYLDAVGLDFASVIERVNAAPRWPALS